MTIDALQTIEGLDTKTGLTNCMDDEQLFNDVLAMFIVQLEQDIPVIRQLFNLGDWIGFGKACHSIKGAAASVGAFKVQEQSAILEKAGKEQDETTIKSIYDNYILLLETTKSAIKESL